jgi:hypothetical protein
MAGYQCGRLAACEEDLTALGGVGGSRRGDGLAASQSRWKAASVLAGETTRAVEAREICTMRSAPFPGNSAARLDRLSATVRLRAMASEVTTMVIGRGAMGVDCSHGGALRWF